MVQEVARQGFGVKDKTGGWMVLGKVGVSL